MNEHCTVMTQFQDNVDKDYFLPEQAESLFCNPMKKMYQSLTKILQDNSIINVVTIEEEQSKIASVFQSIIKMQNEIGGKGLGTESVLQLPKFAKDIQNHLGRTLTQENNSLLSEMISSLDNIDSKFLQLQQQIQDLEINLDDKISQGNH